MGRITVYVISSVLIRFPVLERYCQAGSSSGPVKGVRWLEAGRFAPLVRPGYVSRTQQDDVAFWSAPRRCSTLDFLRPRRRIHVARCR